MDLALVQSLLRRPTLSCLAAATYFFCSVCAITSALMDLQHCRQDPLAHFALAALPRVAVVDDQSILASLHASNLLQHVLHDARSVF